MKSIIVVFMAFLVAACTDEEPPPVASVSPAGKATEDCDGGYVYNGGNFNWWVSCHPLYGGARPTYGDANGEEQPCPYPGQSAYVPCGGGGTESNEPVEEQEDPPADPPAADPPPAEPDPPKVSVSVYTPAPAEDTPRAVEQAEESIDSTVPSGCYEGFNYRDKAQDGEFNHWLACNPKRDEGGLASWFDTTDDGAGGADYGDCGPMGHW